MSTYLRCTLTGVVLTLALSSASLAGGPSADVRLTAQAHVDTMGAVQAARTQPARAERLLRRSRSAITAAGRRVADSIGSGTATTPGTVARFSAEISADSTDLRRLVDASRGRLAAQAKKAVADDARLHSRIVAVWAAMHDDGTDPGAPADDTSPGGVDVQAAVSAHLGGTR
jgi:hypothetical protein